ncbi:MAG TPA: DUF222 domain-containing protein, partial [Streptosporangiaceae bacterium]|nr:DUF222 domain-containing protein [Streptosporangiaceae bacterium]
DDGFTDRSLRLAETFDGAGRLEGDLTPRCAAATGAVLGALSQPRGPEDTRTAVQRQHDALEEAMTRLLAADAMLPQRAGQPVRLELDITLDQLANGGAGSPAGPGSTCDAVIQPVITGLVDGELLARLTDAGPDDPQPEASADSEVPCPLTGADNRDCEHDLHDTITGPDDPQPDGLAGSEFPCPLTGTGNRDCEHDLHAAMADRGLLARPQSDRQDAPDAPGAPAAPAADGPGGMADRGLLARYADPDHPEWRDQLGAAAARAAAEAPFGDVLAQAIALLSGPSGRAAWLRRRATGIPVTTISLPLDIAATFDTIPVHLRRAVRRRDKHCRFPGCDLPAAGCEVHHIQPRKDGGRHALTNLGCSPGGGGSVGREDLGEDAGEQHGERVALGGR